MRAAQDSSPQLRATALSSFRSALQPGLDFTRLESILPQFVALAKDANHEVRRQTLLTMTSLIRTKPDLLKREIITPLLEAIYADMKVRPELKYTVDYVAFKQDVDDGVPLRRAAFACASALYEVIPERLDLQELVANSLPALSDSEAVVIEAASALLWAIGMRSPSKVVERLDAQPDAVMSQVKAMLKQLRDVSGTGYVPASAGAASDAHNQAVEYFRALLSTWQQLSRLPGAELCSKYNYFSRQIVLTAKLKPILKDLHWSS